LLSISPSPFSSSSSPSSSSSSSSFSFSSSSYFNSISRVIYQFDVRFRYVTGKY